MAMTRCLELIGNSPNIQVVDLTGGAPELNKEFRHFVEGARALGKRVIDRCNLTVLLEPTQKVSQCVSPLPTLVHASTTT